ncbi:MAG TPA: kelch repeat-containing protein [Burkholderiaceae bacterium]|nr:kelch repeat-containing protein [Burkholderiaceae bacterium]
MWNATSNGGARRLGLRVWRVWALCLGLMAAGAALGQGRWTRLPFEPGAAPSARSTPVTVALEGDVFLFGGVKDDFAAFQNTFFNDLYRYDVRANTWVPLAPAGALPPARAFAAGVAVPLRRWVVVFGGSRYEPDFSGFTAYDDLWAYDLGTRAWRQLRSVTPGPVGRSGPAMWLAGDQLFVFGGIDAGFQPLNDLWRYDLLLRAWTQLIPNGAAGSPPPRHVAAVAPGALAGRLTLYGGETVTAQGFAFLNDTWSLDLLTLRWQDVTPAAPRNIDPPRNYAAAAVVGGAMLVAGGDMPGGSSGCGSPFDQNPTRELWRFDLLRRAWQQLAPGGDVLPRLKRVTGAQVGGQMYVFSGFDFACNNGVGGQIWNTDVYRYTPHAGGY